MGPPWQIQSREREQKEVPGPVWIDWAVLRTWINGRKVTFNNLLNHNSPYMVRNHKNGYPYINFFFFFENIQKCIFFFEKLIGQWIPDRNWRGIARDIKKNYFHFQNLTKNGNKVWTIKKAEMTLLFSSVLHFFVVVKTIQNRQFFLEKLIGQWNPDRDGRGIARDINKNYFHFQNLTKSGNKVWTI